MKKFFSRFPRWMWIILAAVIVVLIAVFVNSGRETAVLFQTTPVERGNLVATVGATGSVRARQSAMLVWQTNGIVESVNVDVGSVVSANDALASLAKSSLSQNVILAEADLVNAQTTLEDLLTSDTALLEAQRRVDEAKRAYESAYNWRIRLNGKVNLTENIYDEWGRLKEVKRYKDYPSQAMIDQADKDLALAESRLNDARRNYERLLAGPDSAEVAAAKARVEAAQATLNMTYLMAPFNGTITQVFPTVGDQVSAGTVGFRIDDLSSLLVDVQVSEVDINSISEGQPAALTFDAILGREYHGKVVQVGQAGDTVQGVVSFTVTIELTDADELVKPGMTAAVNIVVEEVENILLIPNRAVRLVDGNRVVYLLVDGAPVQVKVRLGASSDTVSEIIEGSIQEGDLIILNPPPSGGGFFGG
jgi:HlyD family secretion protein